MLSSHQAIQPSGFKELIPSLIPVISKYDQAISATKDFIWDNLGMVTVFEALEVWLATLSKLTAKNYRSGLGKLESHGLINTGVSLQVFAAVNHEAVIDRIKKDELHGETWSECTRQARAAAYISFTGFLNRRFNGLITKAKPCKEGNAKTFYKVHEKVKSQAMTQAQWLDFFRTLGEINARDCLIAKLALQGGKRISEVLSLTTLQINWACNEITFIQTKTKGTYKETVITYPKSIMDCLKEYIGEREGLVFITRSGKVVPKNQLDKTFVKAGKLANIPFKISPHVLRASCVTYLKQQGFSDSDIMRVTGHASSAMVYAYDKSSRADNASKRVSLIT